MKRHRLALSLLFLGLLANAVEVSSRASESTTPGAYTAASDIDTVSSRYAQSVLPTEQAQIDRLRELSSHYANSLGADGRWRDVEYDNDDRADWKTAEHLNRTLVMAKMARLERNGGRPDAVLEAKTISALKAWTDRDYLNPNWWWNQIGVPELTGEIATLMQPEVPDAQLGKVIEIMKRSDWRKGPWTGANLTWGVEVEIVRGCLERDAATVNEGYERMYAEIKIVSPKEEGIQQDDSFHQHGAQLYNGGYGLFYANDVGRFIAFAWGTRFQIPADRMAIFSSYILDGDQWMIRGDGIDYSVIGRVITRQGMIVAPQDWTMGPVSPAGPAYSLPNVVAMLAAEPTPRQREFQNFAARLREDPNAPSFTGNKQFWCSDYMVHRRKGFSTSVKMFSNRMQSGEMVNGEGLKSQHLSDGVNFLYLTGDEYKNIFPAWDWTKLPGVTAIQGTLDTGEKNPVGARGATAFAGGVTDGTYGMAAMYLSRGKLTAKKAWFFFDDSYLCLGAGITLVDDPEHSVATDVNQTLLHGAVTSNRSPAPLAEGAYAYTANRASWIYHDHVGYVLAPGSHVNLSVGPQTGKWSDIGSGSNQPVTVRVFNLWIDHGHSPRQSTYQYVVLPGASEKETLEFAGSPTIRVLANKDDIQAAWSSRLKVGMIAFRSPGSLATPAGLVAVDHSCLLLIRRIRDGWRISASNPENLPLALTVKIGDEKITMDLPGGNFAGSSVTTTMRMAPVSR